MPDWFFQRLKWIGLGDINDIDWVVRIIPDATKRSLLFEDVDGIEAILREQVSEGQPVSSVRVFNE